MRLEIQATKLLFVVISACNRFSLHWNLFWDQSSLFVLDLGQHLLDVGLEGLLGGVPARVGDDDAPGVGPRPEDHAQRLADRLKGGREHGGPHLELKEKLVRFLLADEWLL